MRHFRYLHLDVFTDRAMEGNQLAVFPEAQGLDAATMLLMTREMNFSECTFILPPEQSGDVRMRIFAPGREMPMAGHPTIGSTFALAELKVIEPGRPLFTFELPVGPTAVELEWDEAQLSFAWMTQQRPTFGKVAGHARALLQALRLDTDVLADLPVEEVSCGVSFLFLPLESRKAVDQADPDRSGITKYLESQGLTVDGVFLFTLEAGPDEATVYSRMFAPGLGLTEDPATGAASGPLGCYLVKHGLIDDQRALNFVSLQGVKMGRRSRIHVSVEAQREQRGGDAQRRGDAEAAEARAGQTPAGQAPAGQVPAGLVERSANQGGRELPEESRDASPGSRRSPADRTGAAGITRVRVGGKAVLVGEGTLRVPGA